LGLAPRPDGPIFLVGDGDEFPAGIYGVRVANGEKEIPVEQAVGVSMALVEIEAMALRQGFDGVGFGGTIHGGAIQTAYPSTAMFFEAGGTEERAQLQATGFEFAGQRGSGEMRERFQGATDQNDFVSLANVPGDAGDPFFEKRDGVHITEDQIAGDVREVALIAMVNRKQTLGQEPQRLRGPAEVIGH